MLSVDIVDNYNTVPGACSAQLINIPYPTLLPRLVTLIDSTTEPERSQLSTSRAGLKLIER